MADDISASNAAVTLHRELLEAIECKYAKVDHDDLKWPALTGNGSTSSVAEESDEDEDQPLRTHWEAVRDKHVSATVSAETYDLSPLPVDWALVSINITEDRNTMFVSRHQRGHEPLVFCLPLDRQGRREGEEEADLFAFDTAVNELDDIIRCSNESARSAKGVDTKEGKVAWWAERRALDKRMEELLLNLEFVWLGPFKVGCIG
jgi:separase